MGDAFRGLTIRLGADTRPLKQALNSITSSVRAAQKQLTAMNKALQFDGTNTKAMSHRIDLLGDKALLAARAMRDIETAMSQANAKVKSTAESTANVFAEAQKARAEYRHVDAELQTIYDSLKKIRAEELRAEDGTLGFKEAFDKADAEVKKLQAGLRGSKASAKEAWTEVERLFAIASKRKIGAMFDAKGEPEKLLAIFRQLRAEHTKLGAQSSLLKSAQDYKENQIQLEAWRSSMREASAEAARMRTEFHMMTAGEGVAEKTAEIKRMDSALEKATAAAKKMDAAFSKSPKDIELAVAKLRAEASVEEIIRDKLEAKKAIVAAISREIDDEAKSVENVYKWVEKTESELAKWDSDVAEASAKFDGLEGEVKEAKMRLEAFNAELEQTDDKNFVGPRRSIEKIKADIKEAEAAVDKAKAATAEWAGKLDTAEKNAAETRRELERAAKARALKEAKSDVKALTNELAEATHKASALRRALDFSKTVRTAGYGLYSTITPAILMAGRYALESARDIDSAYRDMRKTVNGTEEEFAALRESALEFSTTHFTNAEKILEIEAMGGQLGIAASNLDEFAETVSNLDVATNIDADTVAEQLGKMATVLGIDVKEYDNFGDALVRLGNNMPVMESDIMTLMTRFMGMGKVVGMGADEMLAWSAAASATGQKSEAAGSAMQRFISNMETAVASGGENLEKWASVAGMGAEEFANAFKTNASDAMYKFIEGLARIQQEGGSVNQTLKDLKINNVRDKQLLEGLAVQMLNAAGGASVLGEALRMAHDAYNGYATDMPDGTTEEAGDAAREAAKKFEGFSGQVQKMLNTAQLLASELAEGAIPIVQFLADTFRSLTEVVKSMSPEMKTFTVAALGAVASLGPLGVGIGAVGSFIDAMFVAADKVVASKTLAKAASGGGLFMKALSGIDKVAPTAASGLLEVGAAVSGLSAGAVVAGVAALAGIILTIGTYAHDTSVRVETLRKATEGYVNVAESAKGVDEILSTGIVNDAAAIDRLLSSMDKYHERAEKIKQGNIKLAESWSDQLNEVDANATLIQKYSDEILELRGRVEGSPEKLARLKAALSEYNKLTGSHFSVTNEYTGAIDAQTSAIERNTEAAKLNAYAKAYSEMYKEAVQNAAKIEAEYEKQTQAYADLEAERQRLVENGATIETSDRLNEISVAQTQLTNDIADLEKEAEAAGVDVDIFAKKMGEAAEATDQHSEAAKRARHPMQHYKKAMEELGVSFDEYIGLANELGLGVADLAAELSGAGIETQEFARLGKEGFDNLLAVANGDFSQVRAALDLLNKAEINPKNMRITEEGIEDAEGKLWHLDLAAGTITDGEKVLHIGVDGAEAAAAETAEVADNLENLPDGEINIEDESVSDATENVENFEHEVEGLPPSKDIDVNVTGNAQSALQDIITKIGSIDRNVDIYVTTHEKKTQDAAGGFFALHATGGHFRLHGSGGFITSGPTILGTDPHGYIHIAGEAGREWIKRHADGTTSILPIENRRYLKPYAREIAGMIQAPSYDDSYLIAEIRSLNDAITSMQLVLDGKTVGKVMAPEMNRQLKRLETANAR